jgi:asparagine synthase (glutamine-hydrolysing)
MRRFLVRAGADGTFETGAAAFAARGVEVHCRGYVADPRDAGGGNADGDGARFAEAYGRWGEPFAKHLCGEYAVAICDRARRRLVLAHDELGLLPAFYAETASGIVAGSHLGDVAAAVRAEELDEEYLADYLADGWHFGRRTPYAQVRRLLPGEALVYAGGRTRLVDTWTLNAVTTARRGDPLEDEARLRELVDDGVRAAMRGREKVWCELSGGLDSSTVFTVAASRRAVEAVSFVYPSSPSADERDWIRPVLDARPAPWHAIDADRVRPFGAYFATPYAEPNLGSLTEEKRLAYYALLRENRVDTVLTGLGGDGTFIGDVARPYHFADLLRNGRAVTLARELVRWSRASGERRSATYWLALCAVRPLLRHMRRGRISFDPQPVPWIEPAFANRLGFARRGAASPAPRMRSVAGTWYLESVLRDAHAIAHRYDEDDVPCEFRHPLLYRPLIAHVLSVPWDAKLDPACDRILQRRAFEDVLPRRTVLRRNKQGPDAWFYAGLARDTGWFERLTADPEIVRLGYADRAAWTEAVRRARLGATVGIRHFFASATLEMWLHERASHGVQESHGAGANVGRS